MAKRKSHSRWKKDLLIIGCSAIAAIVVSRSGLLSALLLTSMQSELLGAFVAGTLFTSVFTTPFAIAAFITLAATMDPLTMALLGGVGAVMGDLVLFVFIRHTFQADVDHLLGKRGLRRYAALLHRRTFRWIIPFIGALIIASPLPDELGIALMGVSHMRPRTLIIISYLMNTLGIALIAWAVS